MVWTSRAVRRTSFLSRLGDFFAYALGFTLLFTPKASVPGLWPTPAPIAVLLLAAEFAAFAFAWWARLHLGRLWSGMITLRHDHRVVDTGPYRLVRHPIYTGFIGAAWSYALILGSPTALAGAAVLTIEMAWKARREERFLRRELAPGAYDAYAARTPMLIPGLRLA